jgi:hypothetical protein
MKKKDSVYNQEFYSNQKFGSLSSAKEVIPIILTWFPETKSVIDFGCGLGTWLSVFQENGIKNILGLDGDYVSKDELLIDHSSFQPQDLSQPIALNKKFDLAISLEVAEHLPESCADIFIDNLTNTSDVIVFSAAIPGQGGDSHINEQWQSYWIKKFEQKGYILLDGLKEEIWNNKNVEFWYSQNINIFIKNTSQNNYNQLLKKQPNSKISDIVHPKQLELILQSPIKAENLYFSQTLKLLTQVLFNSIKRRLSK